MGVLFHDMSIDLHMTSTDLGIALGLLISVGDVGSKSLDPFLNVVQGFEGSQVVGQGVSPSQDRDF